MSRGVDQHTQTHHAVRRFPRTEVEIVTDISMPGDVRANSQGAFAVLGAGGALLTSGTAFPIGSMLSFRFRLPDAADEIRCQGVVCNEAEENRMGIEFLDISAGDRARIARFVERHGQQPSLATP